MSRKNKNRVPREPEIVNEVKLLDIAYGGETVARINAPLAETGGPLPDEPAGLPSQTGFEAAGTIAPVAPETSPDASNRVVFVSGGLPGEVVNIELFHRKKSYLRGKVLQVLESSPERREAPCPYFGADKWPNCGGCQWQHASYEAQLGFIGSILKDQFVRLGGIENPPLLEPVGARSSWGYRNNVEFQVDRHTGQLCFHRQNSIRLVPVQSCHIAHPLINLAIEPLTRALGQLIGKVHQVTIRVGPVSTGFPVAAEEITALAPYSQFEAARLAALERFSAVEPLELALQKPRPVIMFILRMLGPVDMQDFVKEMQQALDRFAEISIITEGKKRRLEVLCGPAYLEEVLDGITYQVPPLAFFQSNSPMALELVTQVFEAFEAGGFELRGKRVLDIYCGVGTFSLQLARSGARVLGIEEYVGAIEAAQKNARLNQLEQLTSFVAARAEEHILELEASGEKFEAVLVDPPRRGCDPALLESLLKTKPSTIVYVSCDPSTLARDVKILSRGYDLLRSRVVDLFPQTYHMESVSLLKRREN